MTIPSVDKKVILDRMEAIQKSLVRLTELQKLDRAHFYLDDNIAITEHYLRYALEATFDICSHILARIPGAKKNEYKEFALEMGRFKLVPRNFSEKNLKEMAGYRNRLTHFYFEVTSQELYKIIHSDLDDFRTFLKYIKKFLTKPKVIIKD